MRLIDKHIHLLTDVNNANTEDEHRAAEIRLDGFRIALEAQNINQLIECDMYYINQNIDRPMCCGVFLDWTPTQIGSNKD
jgi:hypothetical protein